MFKIVSAEIKKIVSKPGIYILSLLLAIILVLGAFIYKPKVYESSRFELNGNVFLEKYNDFYAGTNAGKKAESINKLDKAIKSINDYFITYNGETYNQEDYITLLLDKCNEYYDAYQDCSSDESDENIINSVKSNLVQSYENLNEAIETALINSQNGSYSLLTSTKNYKTYKSTYKEVLKWAKSSIQKENLKKHFIEFEKKYSEDFYNSIKNFKYPTLSNKTIKTYTENSKGTKLYILNERLDEISEKIETNHNKALTDSKFNTKQVDLMDELANDYVETIDTFVNLIKYELITNAFSILSTNEELNTLHLSDYSNFNSKSLLERYTYLFDNNKNQNDYGRPLTIGVTSNDYINAYDYAYFTLKIFSFVIIIYSILAACHTIAGEIKEGSMRYFAIRPVSRTKIFFGKWFAILLMSIILILFSAVIALLVGGAVYGFKASTILTIFNGSHALSIHPLGMIAIYLVSMILELIIYSIIAMLMSTLFKSDLMSMTILVVLYLVNVLLPVFVQGANSWLAFYPFSHISLYSLFGSAVYAVPTNFFNLIFGSKIYAGTHVILTLSTILLLTFIISFIAIKIFKKKEL